MIVWASGSVTRLTGGWRGAVELVAVRDDTGAEVRSLAYTDLMAPPAVGDRVLLNVAALDRGLGTGGYALVVAVLGPDGGVVSQPPQPAGHLVKARYLPLQAMVAGADEQGSPHHELLAEADSLDGLPVVVADLHSALAPTLLALAHDRPGTRVVYVMSDQGALPIAFSRAVAQLRDAGLLAGTVTVGQAFGGDLEAVTVHSGLLAARLALGAEVAVVTQGPGNLGTGTRWGFSGVGAGEAVNAVAALDGRPVASLRISGADARRRHRGVSHHSMTAYGRVALSPADLAVPDFSAAGRLRGIDGLEAVVAMAPDVEEAVGRLTGHRAVRVRLDGLDDALVGSPLRLSTMGRGLHGDPAYFLAAAAAGRHAATLLALGPNLTASDVEFRPARVDEGDGARLAQAMAAEIAALYDGLDHNGPDMPKAGPAELGPPGGGFWVGYLAGSPVCCGGVKQLPEPGACEIKKMYVVPGVRGRGIARRLLGFLEGEARALGHRVARLDTGHRQPDAQHLYESAGYTPIANFNANPVATYFAEKALSRAG